MGKPFSTTSIERFHLFDDYPGFPNTIGCRLDIQGDLDLERANAALKFAIERSEIGQCTPSENLKRWEPNLPSGLQVAFEKLAEDDSMTVVPINPKLHRGSRFLWQPTEGGCRLLMFVHHAYADGLGGMQFISDWMTEYHNLSSDNEVKHRAVDHSLLAKRNHLGLLSTKFFRTVFLQPIAMLGSIKFLFRKVVSLGTPSTGDCDPNTGLVSHTLDAKQAKALQQVSEANDRTVNDLILRDVFLGLHESRKQTGQHEKNEWLRIIVPISVRRFRDRKSPVCNRASLVQLDRRDKDFQDRGGLEWGINYELGNVQRWQFDRTFLLLLRLFSWIPGLLKRSARSQTCRATTIVTNIGGPFERLKLPRQEGKIQLGSATIDNIELIAPIRPMTPACFVVCKYNKEIKLCLHYHRDFFDDAAANLLVEHVASQIEQTLDEPSQLNAT